MTNACHVGWQVLCGLVWTCVDLWGLVLWLWQGDGGSGGEMSQQEQATNS